MFFIIAIVHLTIRAGFSAKRLSDTISSAVLLLLLVEVLGVLTVAGLPCRALTLTVFYSIVWSASVSTTPKAKSSTACSFKCFIGKNYLLSLWSTFAYKLAFSLFYLPIKLLHLSLNPSVLPLLFNPLSHVWSLSHLARTNLVLSCLHVKQSSGLSFYNMLCLFNSVSTASGSTDPQPTWPWPG